ncbi:MAG TPA: GAF and ANTAR domain-containing protein [Acidimicrobiales bacterium]|nr:GAF and ANTAR domain-containing protein [Acidimicrobiales bacterium]
MTILQKLRGPGETGGAARLCEVGAEVVGTSGAGVMLMADGVAGGSPCSSDAVSATLEELQFTLGEGPCIDAHRLGFPVLEPDLKNPDNKRWIGFAPAALAAGARAIFGFPIRLGSIRLGALNLYCDGAGSLTDDQHAVALVMADVVARAVLAMQAGAPAGTLSTEIEQGADRLFVVHQASGMVSAQIGVSVGEALLRLRAHAFAGEQPLSKVASNVIAGRLRFG